MALKGFDSLGGHVLAKVRLVHRDIQVIAGVHGAVLELYVSTRSTPIRKIRQYGNLNPDGCPVLVHLECEIYLVLLGNKQIRWCR